MLVVVFFSGQTSVFSTFFDLLLRVDDQRKDSYIVLDYFFRNNLRIGPCSS